LPKIDNLLDLFQRNDVFNPKQWHEACIAFDKITNKITETIQSTCMAPTPQQLTTHTNRLGGFYPGKLKKQWKKLISTHHLIRKIIYII
jgi:hypothetical protein